jgi:hypothetical protein
VKGRRCAPMHRHVGMIKGEMARLMMHGRLSVIERLPPTSRQQTIPEESVRCLTRRSER